MAEYIEREAFIKRLENEADCSSGIIDLLILNGLANIVRDKNIAPAADVVEVVRCKDCIKRSTEDCAMYYECDCGEQHTWECADDFCSYGERLSNDG